MVNTKLIWLYNTERQYYHGMAVNYRGKKFYNIEPWRAFTAYSNKGKGGQEVVHTSKLWLYKKILV
jgi:hypothetical protein